MKDRYCIVEIIRRIAIVRFTSLTIAYPFLKRLESVDARYFPGVTDSVIIDIQSKNRIFRSVSPISKL